MPAGGIFKLSDLDLASRLSFFLWSSIPDDELLDVAAKGRLHEPKVLEQQVKRMLADSKSAALTSNFAGQWLYLRDLASVQTSAKDFDDNLRQAFRRETEMLFESIVREDRSVVDLLNADYTFVDERLARALRHPEYPRQLLPPRGARREQPAPRVARTGQHADRDVRLHAERRPCSGDDGFSKTCWGRRRLCRRRVSTRTSRKIRKP